MAVRKIVKYPEPILKQKAREVEYWDDGLKELVVDMFETCKKYKAAGLAAPQVGVDQRVIVVDVAGQEGVLINPAVVERSQQIEAQKEGCLSLPKVWLNVWRPRFITVQYDDLEGKRQQIAAGGLGARTILHEIDHLDGILILDRVNKKSRKKVGH